MAVERRIRRVMLAARGLPAAERVSVYEAGGLETIVAFDASDADDPHLDEASWACALPPGTEGGASLLRALVGVAMDAGADAFDPSGTPFASDPDAARLVGSVGLAWLGGTAEALAAAGPEAENVAHRCVTCLCDGDGGAVAVADAWMWGDVAVVSGAGPDPRGGVAVAAARAARCGGVVNVHLGASGQVTRLAFGLPEHHALVAVGDRPLAVAAVALHAGESVGGLEERASGAVAVRVAVRAPAAGEAPGAGREVATSGVEARWSEREHVAAGELLAVFRASGPSGQRAMAAHLDRIARAYGPLTDAATQGERLLASVAGHGPARDTLTVP